MSALQPAIEGNQSCIYSYGIKLSRNNWIDLSSFKALKKNKRVFSVYKWCTMTTRKFGMGPQVTASGWALYLTYRGRKWEKPSQETDTSFCFMGAPLAPMHMFFRTAEEFKEWLGIATVESLFADLL